MYGMTGVEAADHAFLEGYGYADSAERERFGRNLVRRDALRGNDLALTVDARLQQAATGLLAGRRGAVVVLDPRTGDVLALASAPAFDPGALTPDIFAVTGDASALLNRATQGLYPPGSTFKIVVAALALEVGFNGTFDCPAAGYVPGPGMKPIRDHEYYSAERRGRTWGGHGRLDLKRALAKSSNVFFAQLGANLGPARFYDEAVRFQLNRTIDLFDGASGSVRCKTGVFPELKPTQRAAASQLAMGQGTLLVTPFGMALVAAAIANDGRLMQPRLSARQPEAVLSTCMTPDAARRLRALMRAVVTEGTARAADLPGLDVAGKTGTAETPRGEDHSWFVCMAPADRPQLVVVALVEHGGFGSAAALPVAVGLLNAARDHGWFGGK